MGNEQPGLLRRLDRTGVPLLACRVILGVILIAMGLAKTGTLERVLDKTGLIATTVVQSLVDKETGYIELSTPGRFARVIKEYGIVPESMPLLLNLIAAALPWFEVMCGVLLIAGVAVRGSALFLLVMLIGFTALVTIRAVGIYHAGGISFCQIKFDCGCGAGEVYICNKIAENATLSLLALVALASRSRRFCLRARLIPEGKRG